MCIRDRVGRGEQGEARRANSTPNSRPRLELARLRLKTWYKTDLSIAQPIGQHFRTCVYSVHEEKKSALHFLFKSQTGGILKPSNIYILLVFFVFFFIRSEMSPF